MSEQLGVRLLPRISASLPACSKPSAHYASPMSTVAEIETAIEKLSPQQISELVVWLEERQRLAAAAESLFQLYDEEESLCRSRVAEKSG